MIEEKNLNRIRIGQRIATIRKERGLTQEQLSQMTGLDRANIGKVENGRYNVSIDILSKICNALGCRVDIVQNIGKVVVTKEERKRLMDHFNGLSNNQAVVVDGNSLVEALNERMKK